jgi:hypothetical protein
MNPPQIIAKEKHIHFFLAKTKKRSFIQVFNYVIVYIPYYIGTALAYQRAKLPKIIQNVTLFSNFFLLIFKKSRNYLIILFFNNRKNGKTENIMRSCRFMELLFPFFRFFQIFPFERRRARSPALSIGMFYKLKKQRAAAPLPSRGGAGVGSVTFLLTEHY